jgi:hypothetical protein
MLDNEIATSKPETKPFPNQSPLKHIKLESPSNSFFSILRELEKWLRITLFCEKKSSDVLVLPVEPSTEEVELEGASRSWVTLSASLDGRYS